MVYNREESFYGHVHRHPAKLYYEHGADRDGKLAYVRAASTSTVGLRVEHVGVWPTRPRSASVRTLWTA